MTRALPSSPEERRAAQRARSLATCRHWRGALAQPPCAAGIDLVARVGPRRMFGWGLKIPCLDNPSPAFDCARKDTPTAAEIDARQEDLREAMKHTLAIMAAIPTGPARGGTLPCPKCGGAVRWSRAPSNGHLSAACDAGCVAFVE